MTAPSPDRPSSGPPEPGPAPGPAPGYGPVPGYGPPPGYAPPPGYVPPAGYGPYPYAVRPPAVSPAGQPLAGFGERLGAYLIDSLIWGLAAMALVLPPFVVLLVGWWIPALEAQEASGTTDGAEFVQLFAGWLLLQAAFIVLILGVAYLYHVELMFRSGQTLGKRALKLRVVPLDPTGRLDRAMAIRRYVVQFGGGTFIPAFSYVDGLWQLWDKPYQQCLHDKYARTVVVKVAS